MASKLKTYRLQGIYDGDFLWADIQAISAQVAKRKFHQEHKEAMLVIVFEIA